MQDLTLARARLALLALALGGFGIGTTEFVAMGLLPEIAAELLPDLWASAPEQATADAGHVISAYALGVVVGAPTIATVAARFPRRGLLVVLAAAFAVASALSAAAPTYELAIAARFVSGLPHGAYFGVASLVAATLLGPGKRGLGVALVFAGLTVANVVGVPAITALGQVHGWRAAYLAVAGLFALTTAAVALLVPAQPGNPEATVRRELGALRHGQLWFAVAIASIGFGGFFAVYSYIAPLTTEITGLGSAVVPWVLATAGLGMTVGNLVGGRLADRGPLRALVLTYLAILAALVFLALAVSTAVGLFVGIFAVGAAAAAVSPAIQTRLMDVAPDSQTLAAALNHAALNAGNALGAALGAAVIAAGLGYQAPTWLGIGIAAVGLVLALASRATQRRTDRRADAVRPDLVGADA